MWKNCGKIWKFCFFVKVRDIEHLLRLYMNKFYHVTPNMYGEFF